MTNFNLGTFTTSTNPSTNTSTKEVTPMTNSTTTATFTNLVNGTATIGYAVGETVQNNPTVTFDPKRDAFDKANSQGKYAKVLNKDTASFTMPKKEKVAPVAPKGKATPKRRDQELASLNPLIFGGGF